LRAVGYRSTTFLVRLYPPEMIFGCLNSGRAGIEDVIADLTKAVGPALPAKVPQKKTADIVVLRA